MTLVSYMSNALPFFSFVSIYDPSVFIHSLSASMAVPSPPLDILSHKQLLPIEGNC